MEVDNNDPKHITATISAENSLDGIAHEEKLARVFNLYVQGVHVNGDNCDNILEDGTVSFDPESATLTLEDADIEIVRREYGDDNNEYGIRAYLPVGDNMDGGTSINKDLTINLIGDNSIKLYDGEDDTKNVYGIWYNGNASEGINNTKITGDGYLSINMYAGNDNYESYNGIFGHSPLEISGAELYISIPGDKKTNGIGTLYSNPVKLNNNAIVTILTGENEETYAFNNSASNNQDLSVEKGSIFEAFSENKAFKNIAVTNDTKELGAFVNEEIIDSDVQETKDAANIWDKETDLNTYKYVLIPGEYYTLTFRFSAMDDLDKVEPIEVKAKPNSYIYRALGYDDEDKSIYYYDPLFELDGYKAAGVITYYRTLKPYTEYSNASQIEEDLVDNLLAKGDMDIYCLMNKTIDKLDFTIDKPNDGDIVDMEKNEDGEWDPETASNYPKITLNTEKVKENSAVWAISTNDEEEPYEIFVGEFIGGNKYLSVGYFTAEFGYTFADETVVTTNGKNIDIVPFWRGNIITIIELECDKAEYGVKEKETIDEWYKGSSENGKFVFERNVNDHLTFPRFLSIKLDDKDVDNANYKASAGSAIIELNADYLETLSLGEHKLTAIFNDGQADATFVIKEKQVPSPTPSPKPGPKPIIPNTSAK